MVQIKLIRSGSVNCFLLVNGHDAILVDTGRVAHRTAILAACQPYQIRLIVLTHGHVDHIQNAAFFAQALHCPIAMAQEDVELIADNLVQPLAARGFFGPLLLSASLRSMQKDSVEAFTPDILFKEGDSLREYGIDATVIALPGHTKGSIGIDVGEQGILVGDTLMNFLSPTISMLYNDKQALLQSAEKISALGPRKIYFGHGKPAPNRTWR